jgi:ribosomal protein S15P/S13E
MPITAERKKEIVKEFARGRATLAYPRSRPPCSEHITNLTEHPKLHRKDFTSRRAP